MENAVGEISSILVLGGASEIAVATVEELVRGGLTKAVLAGRDIEALADVGEKLSTVGVSAVETVTWDAADVSGQRAFIDQTFDDHGDFDAVLVAAGVLGSTPDALENADEAIQVFEVNFAGTGVATLAAAARLREQGHGTLIVISSVAAVRPRRSNFVYGSTKAGTDFLARGLASALEGSGARLMLVRPGFVRTKMTAGMEAAPLAVDPPDVAKAISAGLRNGRMTIWVPGVLRYVAWVFRHLPGFAWRRLEELEN